MYCVKCGVQLADTENSCPLCHTRVYHPDLHRPEVAPLYPKQDEQVKPINRWSIMLIVSILYLLPISICLVCDLTISGKMEWSGYVLGAMSIFYAAFLLPAWFDHPNPVIFVPCTFAVIAAFLLYISWKLSGTWFLTFALPVTGAFGLLVTALVTLLRYIRRGRLYIYGGFTISLGVFCVLLEILLHITFGLPGFGTWSLYPLVSLALLGLAMIATAIFRPLREALEKRFFL